MLNILSTAHRRRAINAADRLFELASNEAVSDRSLAGAMAKLPENELRAAQVEIQRRADQAAACVRSQTADMISGALVTTTEWLDAKAAELPDTTLAAEIADWLEIGGHTRPFWRDGDFIAEFGPVRRVDLQEAVTELRRRAERKAEAARIPNPWPAGLAERHDEGIHP